ncbi:MAG: putative endonuclease [Frankiales bacterium]|nr:putative endonuclease [Frankiales bacterium]
MATHLRSVVDTLVTTDLSVLSVAELQSTYVAVAPQLQRLTGLCGAVLAELQARTGGLLPTEDGKPRPLAGWAAEASGDSASAAGRDVRVSVLLRTGLPRVAQAVLDGQVPSVRAEVLTRLVGRIDALALAEAEPALMETAKRMDPQQLTAYVRHLLATWVEPVIEDAEAAAHAARYLQTRRRADGSLWGSFLLPAGDAEGVLTCVEALARRQGDEDTRSAAQRRADALSEMSDQVLGFGDLPETGGFRPQLSYVLPAEWAARRTAEHTCADCSRCPQHRPATFADLVAAGVPTSQHSSDRDEAGAVRVHPATHACAVAAWTGPQTRARIETMLCDARITRVLLDSVGQVTGLEPLRDTVTKAQRRALAARDLGCAARGCTRPPAFCDAHHLIARADGGGHTLANLVLLCRRHHVLWHLGKLTLDDLHVPWTNNAAGPAPPRPMPPPPPAPAAAEVLDLFRG